MFTLKDTEETWPLNVTCGPSLSPFAIYKGCYWDNWRHLSEVWVLDGSGMSRVMGFWWLSMSSC